jgi:diguanylate cyclase (GGDEF)-like protein
MGLLSSRVARRVGSLSVSTKILAVLLIATTVSAVVGVAALTQTTRVASQGESIYHNALVPNAQLADLRETVVQARFDVLSRANSKTPAAFAFADAGLRADDLKITSVAAAYGRRTLDRTQRTSLAQFNAAWLAYKDVRDNKMTPALAAGDIAAYEHYRTTELLPLVNTILTSLNSLSAQADRLARGHLERAAAAQSTARRVVGVLLVLGVGLALVMGTALARAIVRPLKVIRDVLDAVAQDDLTLRAHVDTTDEFGQMATSLNTSIGNLRRLHEALKQQVRSDSLTGLPNRAALAELLDVALGATDAATGNTLLFIDLDGFKLVNDRWGHGAGDELLIEAATRIQACVRDIDIVARIGGDEFVVLCGDVAGLAVAQDVAARIVDSFATPFVVGSHDATVSASIGIAHAGAGSTPHELLRQADVAMYHAKALGKSRYAIYDDDTSFRREDPLLGVRRS